MNPRSKFALKYFATLLLGFLIVYGVALSLGIILIMPLIRWAMYDILVFPISAPELWRLGWLIVGLASITAVVLWIEGKWSRRW